MTECLQGLQSQSRFCSPVPAVHSFARGSALGIGMPASGSSEDPGKAAATPKRTCYDGGPTFLRSRYRYLLLKCQVWQEGLGFLRQGQRAVLGRTAVGLSITLP